MTMVWRVSAAPGNFQANREGNPASDAAQKDRGPDVNMDAAPTTFPSQGESHRAVAMPASHCRPSQPDEQPVGTTIVRLLLSVEEFFAAGPDVRRSG